MAIDFPGSPVVNQVFVAPNGTSYQWTGVLWKTYAVNTSMLGGSFMVQHSSMFLLPSSPGVLALNTVNTGNEGNWYNPANGRYTPPAGRFFLSLSLSAYHTGAASHITVFLYLNGAPWQRADDTTATANYYANPVLNLVVNANGTDYFEMWGQTSSGGTTNAQGTFLSIPVSGAEIGGSGINPTGMIVDFAGAVAPVGWLLCQGQSLLRTDYPKLFAVITTTYGAADGTHFNLPDLGGRVTAGKEVTASRLTTAGAGIDGATLGASGGTQTHSLTEPQLAAHVHSLASHGHTFTAQGSHTHGSNIGAGTTWISANSGQGNYYGLMSSTYDVALFYTGVTEANTVGGSTAGPTVTNGGSAGSGTAHQNTQPTIIMNKIIKT